MEKIRRVPRAKVWHRARTARRVGERAGRRAEKNVAKERKRRRKGVEAVKMKLKGVRLITPPMFYTSVRVKRMIARTAPTDLLKLM
tara:strand:- start:280 stop:537 length:258 start_codon:yes stop_codon:yes gene_type:complete